jgi:hypothetical protein
MPFDKSHPISLNVGVKDGHVAIHLGDAVIGMDNATARQFGESIFAVLADLEDNEYMLFTMGYHFSTHEARRDRAAARRNGSGGDS